MFKFMLSDASEILFYDTESHLLFSLGYILTKKMRYEESSQLIIKNIPLALSQLNLDALDGENQTIQFIKEALQNGQLFPRVCQFQFRDTFLHCEDDMKIFKNGEYHNITINDIIENKNISNSAQIAGAILNILDTLVPDIYNLGSASQKNVDTSISTGSTSANLPTSAAVVAFVEGKGYMTTDTDTKNTAGATDSSSKLYLIGATSQSTNPQTYSDNEVFIQDGVINIQEATIGTRMVNSSIGTNSFAQGQNVEASGNFSHAEGQYTTASGNYSHAEGQGYYATSNVLINDYSNPTTDTDSSGRVDIEDQTGRGEILPGGELTINGHSYKIIQVTPLSDEWPYMSCTIEPGLTLNDAASIVKNETVALYETKLLVFASGQSSHAEGSSTSASGNSSHAEGQETVANANSSHAEGQGTTASGKASHAEGAGTKASGFASHAEGGLFEGDSTAPIISVQGTITNFALDSIGFTATTTPSGNNWADAAYFSIDNTNYHAVISGDWDGDTPDFSITFIPELTDEEQQLITIDETSISLCRYGSNMAAGKFSHVEGLATIAFNDGSHAEGSNTHAAGYYSHAEGNSTQALGDHAHAEGNSSKAFAYAHAEGNTTEALGRGAHAEGHMTLAQGMAQHVEGSLNIQDRGSFRSRGQYIHIAGNGQYANARSNAYTLDWSGNGWFAGDVYVGSTSGTNKDAGSKKLATEEYVRNLLQEFATLNNLNMPS